MQHGVTWVENGDIGVFYGGLGVLGARIAANFALELAHVRSVLRRDEARWLTRDNTAAKG